MLQQRAFGKEHDAFFGLVFGDDEVVFHEVVEDGVDFGFDREDVVADELFVSVLFGLFERVGAFVGAWEVVDVVGDGGFF